MPWFNVDDGFADHPKVLAAQSNRHWKGAIALWTMAGAWSAKQLSDGLVPRAIVLRMGFSDQEAELLVTCKLWERAPSGFKFHDWDSRNPTRDKVEAARKRTRERVERWRSNNDVTQLHKRSVTTLVTPPLSSPLQSHPDPDLRAPSDYQPPDPIRSGSDAREDRVEPADGLPARVDATALCHAFARVRVEALGGTTTIEKSQPAPAGPKLGETADVADAINADPSLRAIAIPTMRKLFELARAGERSKSEEILRSPNFAFACWRTAWRTELREALDGTAPRAPLSTKGSWAQVKPREAYTAEGKQEI